MTNSNPFRGFRDPAEVIRERQVGPGQYILALASNATFVQLPKLLRTLEGLPPDVSVQLRTATPLHLNHTTREAINVWAARRRRTGARVDLSQLLTA